MSQKYIIILVASILTGSTLIAGAIFLTGKNGGNISVSPSPSGSASHYSAAVLDNFAKCLNEKGLVFYGAWWCSHCQNQKAEFGEAFKYVNYVECEKNPGVSQGDLVPACVEKNIEAYPTWIMADGTKKTGEYPLETLAQMSGCELKNQ